MFYLALRVELALFGAHDANRTRDLVLTKDVLCQLSYVGTLIILSVDRDASLNLRLRSDILESFGTPLRSYSSCKSNSRTTLTGKPPTIHAHTLHSAHG